MFKYLFSSFFIFVCSYAFSQDYMIDQWDGQTITGCSGNFYDSGGHAHNC
ncbi:MAG: hypothetical protein ABIJ16_01435 [Bacteroidota bacterium]